MPNNPDNQDDKIYLYSLRFIFYFLFAFLYLPYFLVSLAKILPEESQNVLKELQESLNQ